MDTFSRLNLNMIHKLYRKIAIQVTSIFSAKPANEFCVSYALIPVRVHR
jgi:hypothetical protein